MCTDQFGLSRRLLCAGATSHGESDTEPHCVANAESNRITDDRRTDEKPDCKSHNESHRVANAESYREPNDRRTDEKPDCKSHRVRGLQRESYRDSDDGTHGESHRDHDDGEPNGFTERLCHRKSDSEPDAALPAELRPHTTLL